MVKNFLWDFDGTLFDAYPVMSEAFYKTCQEYKVRLKEDEIYCLMKQSLQAAIDETKLEKEEKRDFLNRFKEIRFQLEIEKMNPYPGVESLLQEIQAQKGVNYIVTHRGSSTQSYLDKFGLSKYFQESVTSDYGFERKPSPQSILYLLQKYSMNPQETMMIGDRQLDIDAGKKAGIKTCLFDEHQEESVQHADFRVTSFQDFYERIRKSDEEK